MSTPVIRAGNCSEPFLAGCKIVQKEFIEHLNSETVAPTNKSVKVIIRNRKKNLTSVPYCQFQFLPTHTEKFDFKIHPYKKE